jgi:hypothetical protein
MEDRPSFLGSKGSPVAGTEVFAAANESSVTGPHPGVLCFQLTKTTRQHQHQHRDITRAARLVSTGSMYCMLEVLIGHRTADHKLTLRNLRSDCTIAKMIVR